MHLPNSNKIIIFSMLVMWKLFYCIRVWRTSWNGRKVPKAVWDDFNFTNIEEVTNKNILKLEISKIKNILKLIWVTLEKERPIKNGKISRKNLFKNYFTKKPSPNKISKHHWLLSLCLSQIASFFFLKIKIFHFSKNM